MSSASLAGAGGLVSGLLLGSLVEYVAHRLMHAHKLVVRTHRKHHKKADAQGVWGEFTDYFRASLLFGWLGFLVSPPFGGGHAIGAVLYAFLAAYAHQLNHERPELVFWMPRPVHYLHHKHNLWQTNFGILVDVWDRLLGTYEVVEWAPAKRPFEYPLRAFVDIGWFRRGGTIVPVARPRTDVAETLGPAAAA